MFFVILIFFFFQSDRERWQIVFAINAVILPIGGLIYNVFGRMELQDWDSPKVKHKVRDGEGKFKVIAE